MSKFNIGDRVETNGAAPKDNSAQLMPHRLGTVVGYDTDGKVKVVMDGESEPSFIADHELTMSKEQIKAIVSEEAAQFGFGWSVTKMVDTLYFRLTTRFAETGVNVCILNDRYMIVGGMSFNFPRRKSVGHYLANVFDDKNA